MKVMLRKGWESGVPVFVLILLAAAVGYAVGAFVLLWALGLLGFSIALSFKSWLGALLVLRLTWALDELESGTNAAVQRFVTGEP